MRIYVMYRQIGKVLEILDEVQMPEELVLSTSLKRAEDFVNTRKLQKRRFPYQKMVMQEYSSGGIFLEANAVNIECKESPA